MVRAARLVGGFVVFVTAVTVTALNLFGYLDALGHLGRWLESGNSMAIAALLMLTIFIVLLGPEIRARLVGEGVSRAREKAVALTRDTTIGNMKVYTFGWLFLQMEERLGGGGMETRNVNDLIAGHWHIDPKILMSRFHRDGLLTADAIYLPDRHANMHYQITPLGVEVAKQLKRRAPAPPSTIGADAISRHRFYRARRMLYSITPARWRPHPESTHDTSGDQS